MFKIVMSNRKEIEDSIQEGGQEVLDRYMDNIVKNNTETSWTELNKFRKEIENDSEVMYEKFRLFGIGSLSFGTTLIKRNEKYSLIEYNAIHLNSEESKESRECHVEYNAKYKFKDITLKEIFEKLMCKNLPPIAY